MTENDQHETEIQHYYKITHPESWHGGSSLIKVAVTEETNEEIRGYRFRDTLTRGHQLQGRLTVRKDNVAAWEEFHPLPDQKRAHVIKEDYVKGRIDEDQLEQQLEETNGA